MTKGKKEEGGATLCVLLSTSEPVAAYVSHVQCFAINSKTHVNPL